jgi:uncharacterized membrane protein
MTTCSKNAVGSSYNTEFVMKALCLIIWMVISLLFVCSIIGLVMFILKTMGTSKITPLQH